MLTPERKLARMRERYHADPEKARAYKREYDRNRTPEQKEAAAAVNRAWRAANQLAQREYKKKRYRDMYDRVQAIKVERGCSRCGINHPAVLDFHHEGDKEEAIATMIARVSWEKLLVEIDKCVVICSNCHRLLHWEARQS